jgi:hypothetical protein
MNCTCRTRPNKYMMLNKLNYLREAGQSYSDVILRLATVE